MSFNLNEMAEQNSGPKIDYGLATAGAQYGYLMQVINLGKQANLPYNGQPKDPEIQIEFVFELIGDRVEVEEDGVMVSKPRWIGTKGMNLFTSENSKLQKMLRGMDPGNVANGDVSQLLGKAFIVNVAHKVIQQGKNAGKTIAKIDSVTTVPPGSSVPPMENEAIAFNFYEPDKETYKKLPYFKRNILKGALDFEGSLMQQVAVQADAEVQAQQQAQQPQAGSTPVAQPVAPTVQPVAAPVATPPLPVAPAPTTVAPAPVVTAPAQVAPVVQPVAPVPPAPAGSPVAPVTTTAAPTPF